MGMRVREYQHELRSQANVMPSITRGALLNLGSSNRFNVLNQKQNARNAQNNLRKEEIPMAGGGKLKLTLPAGAKKDVVNDALMSAIDKAMALPENASLRGRQVMLKNTDPKARLTKAPKTNMMISGFTLAAVPDHGTTNIHYHNASGKIAGSKYGMVNYTASGSNNFDHTETTGHFAMKYVGDDNSMKSANLGNYRGELAAQSTGTNIVKGDIAAKGTETALSNSSISGRVNAMVEIAQDHVPGAPAMINRSMEEFGAAMKVSRGYNLGVSMNPTRPELDTSAFQSSQRRRNEMQLAA